MSTSQEVIKFRDTARAMRKARVPFQFTREVQLDALVDPWFLSGDTTATGEVVLDSRTVAVGRIAYITEVAGGHSATTAGATFRLRVAGATKWSVSIIGAAFDHMFKSPVKALPGQVIELVRDSLASVAGTYTMSAQGYDER